MTATVVGHGLPVSPIGPAWRRRGRQARGIALWLLVLVIAASALAWLGRGEADTYLDPRGTGQQGIGALVAVLEDRGVTVDIVTTLEEVEAARARLSGDDAVTLALGASSFLGTEGASRLIGDLRSTDDLVVLDPSPAILDALDTGYGVLPFGTKAELHPDCAVPATHDAVIGRADARFVEGGGAVSSTVVSCYPPPDISRSGAGESSFLISGPATSTRPHSIAIGFGSALTNRYVTDKDHAALGVRLLGAHAHLIVYTPSITDVLGTKGSSRGQVEPPAWLSPGLILVGLAVVAFAVAVGRRHGRLVPEPLPVVVKASESTHSRAELYRAARDRARAAATLRAGTLTRLRKALALGPRATTSDVVQALSAHGIPALEGDTLLAGPEPLDDAALVRLADDLTILEQKVTRP